MPEQQLKVKELYPSPNLKQQVRDFSETQSAGSVLLATFFPQLNKEQG